MGEAAVLTLSVLNLPLHFRYSTDSAVSVTGVSMERLLFSFHTFLSPPPKKTASFTLCALTVTSGAEASKLRQHRGEATSCLNRDSERPLRRMLARNGRCTVIWSVGDSYNASSFYLLYLFISVNTTK